MSESSPASADPLPEATQPLSAESGPPTSSPDEGTVSGSEVTLTTPETSIEESAPSAEPTDVMSIEQLSELSLEALLEMRVTTRAASLFEETSLEAPATVDVVSEAAWRRIGAKRMLEALAATPASVPYMQAFGGQGFAIRGYPSTNGTVRGVAVLLDGIPLNELRYGTALYAFANLQLPSLSRIDLIRGPGSAIYGSDAFHGVMSLRTFASEENVYEGGVEAGSDDFHRGFARFSQSIGDELRLDVAASYSAQPDQNLPYHYTDPATGSRMTSTRAWAHRGYLGSVRLRYTPESSRVDASISFYSATARAIDMPGLGRPSGTVSLLTDRDISNNRAELYASQATVGVDLPHGIRAEATGYGWYAPTDVMVQLVASTPSGPITPDLMIRSDDWRAGAKLTVQQDRLASRFHTQWLFGYEYSHPELAERDWQRTTLDNGTPIDGRTPTAGIERNVHSLFLSAQTRLASERIRLHYGGRLDWFDDAGFQASPRLGVVAMPRSDVALKVLYGRAFRPPVAGERMGSLPLVAGSTTLDPETIGTIELVAQIQRERVRAGITLFGSKWRDGIIIVPRMAAPGEPPTIYANAGENSSGGAELSFNYADRGWRVDMSGSYVRSRNDTTENDYTAFPQIIANLGVGYRYAPARLEFYVFQRLLGGWTEAPESATFPNPPDLPASYQVNVHVSWEAIEDVFDVFLDMRNVLDRSNRTPSTWSAEGGHNGMPYNASVGLRLHR